MVKVIFVHTMLPSVHWLDRSWGMATVIFGDLEIFSIPVIDLGFDEVGNRGFHICVEDVIIDREMRKLAEEAILDDCWRFMNA